MAKHAEFDVILRWAGEDTFDVTILFNAPGDIEDYQYFSTQPVSIDLTDLAALRDDIDQYGRELGRQLFGPGGTPYLDRALHLAGEMPVYMRLGINEETPVAYRTVCWEALRHPTSGVRLTTSENFRFCRYLSNPDATPPSPLGMQGRLSALVVVANPADIEGHQDGLSRLSQPDVEAEVSRAKTALGELDVRVLGEEGKGATITNIVEALRPERVDVLYLVCHGMLDVDGPVLFLENERGNVQRVNGAELADRIGDLGPRVPTLAVLISCQSAGAEHAAAGDASDVADAVAASASSLMAFGPAISRAGCAVVIAMQGNISMDTAALFIPRFFKELKRDGVAAHAMAVARSAITEQEDWYVPVLYSRLKRGSAWYVPRFGSQKATRFKNLHIRMAEENCTPIIGSGIAAEDGILPTREQLASDWAERRQAPIVGYARKDLASVAQYVAVDSEERAVPRDELRQYLRSYLKKEYGAILPDRNWRTGKLEEHISAVGKHQRALSGTQDCYSHLASLDLPVFVTTAWSSLLEDALKEAEKKPQARHFEWYRSLPSISSTEDDFDVRAPLVYHLFGTLDTPQSLVLTEDDYFAWLRAWIKQIDKGVGIPDFIKPALMERSLLFVGYALDDWEFRMIFEAIRGFEGMLLPYSRHVGVQLQPGSVRIEPEAAQEYLEEYFGTGNLDLDVYWGSCREFLGELDETRPRDE